MKKTPLIATAVLTAASVAAIALADPTLTFAANADSNAAQACTSSLTQRLTTNLKESGFTNVKVMPSAFSVEADDKSGNPVKMFITPNSMAEVTASDKSGNPETMFVTPHSMAVVPTKGSSNRL
jgi:hypothetical protein